MLEIWINLVFEHYFCTYKHGIFIKSVNFFLRGFFFLKILYERIKSVDLALCKISTSIFRTTLKNTSILYIELCYFSTLPLSCEHLIFWHETLYMWTKVTKNWPNFFIKTPICVDQNKKNVDSNNRDFMSLYSSPYV